MYVLLGITCFGNYNWHILFVPGTAMEGESIYHYTQHSLGWKTDILNTCVYTYNIRMVRLQLLQNQSEHQSPMLKTLLTQTLSTMVSKWVGSLSTTRRVWSHKIIQVYKLISQSYCLLLFCVGSRWGELVTQFPTVYSTFHVKVHACNYALYFVGSRGVEYFIS